jgi:uncharacterized protein (TIGR02266 family)
MNLFCPFCTKEIESEEIQCPWCNAVYSLGTLLLLRKIGREAPPRGTDEHRRETRVPKTLRVTYSTRSGNVGVVISNLSVGGLFVKTEEPLSKGEKTELVIFLPDKKKKLEVTGKVVWTSTEERVTPDGVIPPGMGVKFLNLSNEGIERIINVLSDTAT